MSRKRAAGLVAAVVLGLIVVLSRSGLLRTLGAGRGGFPAPTETKEEAGPSYADFVGAESCAECHRSEYDAWKGSTHGNAGGPPTRDRVIAPFGGAPIRFRDAVVTPAVTKDGRYTFTVAQPGRPTQVLRVAQVVGAGHMVGGGTQSFFAEFPDGTIRFLPFDYARREGVWFCNTNGRTNQGWVPITRALAIADCGDWPPARVLGAHDRFENCQQCHGSQIQVAFDPGARRYATRFTTLAVNCESCHGPGRRHVALARSRQLGAVDVGMRPLATLDKDRSLETCFQCHALKGEIRPGYLPGRPLLEYFALKLPLLSNRPYFPDGRTRLFAYQEGHLASDCYLNGSMTCVDCHDPHSQRYRDIDGAPLAGRSSDGQCLDCHASKAESPERHSHHPAASPGSRCVSCHMPYLQQPNLGLRLRYARSDHTIPIPRPEFDAKLGIENACRQCHGNQPVSALQAQVTAWYGELKPHADLIDGLVRAQLGEVTGRAAAARVLLAPRSRHPMPQFAGLAYFFLSYLSPDVRDLEAEIVDRLKGLTDSADPDVQALALMSLHFAHGKDPVVRSFLAARLRALRPGARDEAIRRRWVWMLNFRGDAYLAQDAFQDALVTYQKAQEILPDDPLVLRNVGVGYANLGKYGEAIAQFRRSLGINPIEPMTLVNLAFVLTQTGDFAGGVAAYRRAIEFDPGEATTYLSLGNAYLRRGMVESAIDAYERAVALDPALAPAQFALGRAYGQRGQYDRAIPAVERGLEFDPGNAGARQLLDALRRGRAAH